MAIRAVILDVDGTLLDTNGAHVEAWRKAFRLFGHDVPAGRIVPEVGKGGDQLVPAILGREGEGEHGQAIRDVHGKLFLQEAERQHFRVFPGVEDLLTELHRRGLRTALATSSKRDYLEATERSAGIDLQSKVDEVITAEGAGASKPAPDLVQSALKKLGEAPDRCVFVGDTTHDVEASRRAGVRCVGVACGGCFTAAQLRDAGAASVWRDPADLLRHLDEALATSRR